MYLCPIQMIHISLTLSESSNNFVHPLHRLTVKSRNSHKNLSIWLCHGYHFHACIAVLFSLYINPCSEFTFIINALLVTIQFDCLVLSFTHNVFTY